MTIELVTTIFCIIAGLIGLALVICDIDYAKRNNLPPRWIWSEKVVTVEATV